MTHARDAAAKEYQDRVLGLVGYIVEPPGWDEAFLAGIKWAIAHDPVVVQMREALLECKRGVLYMKEESFWLKHFPKSESLLNMTKPAEKDV